MTRRLVILLFYCTNAIGASAVLNGGSHAATMIGPAITAVGGTVDSSVFVDYIPDPAGNPVPPSSNTSGTPFKSVAGNTADNHAVYPVINASTLGYDIGEDETNYPILQPQGTVYSRPYARVAQGSRPAGTPPPIVEVVSSSPASTNGGTGNGIEFALSAGYLGLDTTADSWVSAEIAGMLAQLQVNHPTWTWGDIKAALRQTAANWATGYDPTAYGYGAINWAGANALSSTTALYLQPPNLVAGVLANHVQITVYPFRSSRRVNEVIYQVPATGCTWATKNEYVLSDITQCAGASLVYTTAGSDLITNATLSGTPAPGTVNLIAFTADGAGHFSRVESFSIVTTPAVSCL